ncbi:MAG: hypothetical protein OXB98_22280 [Bryobacterales bacterium]|nr:hypothetical protein [Bryobacterales bacterium]
MAKPYNVKTEELVKLATESVQSLLTGEASADETARDREAILLVGAAICERLERIAAGIDPYDQLDG